MLPANHIIFMRIFSQPIKSFIMTFLRNTILALVAVLFLTAPARADEGMWLPIYLHVIKGDMDRLGARLTPDDIYNINRSSIKDAIVQMGNFCTGEIVSREGLVFTNHHCGYDAIAGLSDVGSNLLDGGFWAKTRNDELPVDGLTMKILVRMEDITARMNDLEDEGEDEFIKQLQEEASEDGRYEAEVVDMFYGTEHYLMVYEVFTDIRLVGAPPSSIGKFGGDTDNWMWPRHTGDFSVFRIYAGTNNAPAPYSPDNKPYVPKHTLPISLQGYDEGSFAFIMGFPGTTDRQLTSDGARKTVTHDYPQYVKILEQRLAIMKRHMDMDEKVRIALASDHASLANSHKYFKGVVERSQKSDFIVQKQEFEGMFKEWATHTEERNDVYGDVVENLAALYSKNMDNSTLVNYLNMAGFGPEFVTYGFNYFALGRRASDDEALKNNPALLDGIRASSEAHFDNYNAAMDREMLVAMSRLIYTDMPENLRPDVFSKEPFSKLKDKKKADRFEQYADLVFKKSILANPKAEAKWLKKPSMKKLENDPGYQYVMGMINLYIGNMFPIEMANMQEAELMGSYITGMREMQPERRFYPEANSTLRFTYGTVKPYPDDFGDEYEFYTLGSQILEKYIPGDEEFDVPAELLKLIRNKDYGRYGNDGDIVVNFITNNDITGGNSGSPVMNADGHLIGIAFDGNWESMLSDLYFDDTVTRTISVDIRYVLFVIDKVYGASHLLEEMEIVE